MEITEHRFVGKREWGIKAPDDAPCQYQTTKTNHPSGLCGYPKAAHGVKIGPCRSVLMIRGEAFGCETDTYVVGDGHKGWAHSNMKAEAVWGEPMDAKVHAKMRGALRDERVEFEAIVDPVTPLVDFMRWMMDMYEITGDLREIAETYCRTKGLIE